MYRLTDLGGDEQKPILSNSTQTFDEEKIVRDHKALVRFCPRADNLNL
jgi:hypothetical protein